MRSRWTAVLAAFALVLGGCKDDDGPTGPDTSDLEIRVVSGQDQFAPAGQPLDEPLVVQVRDEIDLDPESGIRVEWVVTQGAGASLDRQSTTTDAQGRASVTLTLGPSEGEYRVEAAFDGLEGAPATFTARAVTAPTITDLPEGPVQAGQVVTMGGEDFSANASENLVLFSGIRGEVTTASSTELQVRVPACLPTRSVDVTAGFGAVRSQARTLEVEAAGSPLELEVGQDRTSESLDGTACVKLEVGTRWMAVVQSASRTDGPVFDYELTGLLGGDAASSSRQGTESGRLLSAHRGGDLRVPGQEPQAEWEGVVRGLERELPLPGADERRRGSNLQGSVDVPEVGDRREFNVLNRDREFDRITAEVVFVGDHAVMYEDLDAPDEGLTAADFQALAGDFDEFTYPEVTGVFGSVSDLDQNQRVVILFTPVVNRLTDEGSDGFVGGFFFGLDLLPDREGSNGGEVFYSLVADPEGEFGDARSRDLIRRVVPGVLAHEFQHMVNFNQRALVRDGDFTDVLWVSEGMALMAEDVVGEAFRQAGDSSKADLYQSGNWARAQRYLRDPGGASLVATQGQGSLEERGGWWLFFRYLRGQRGDNGVLTELTQTTRTGVSNVEVVTGRGWSSLVADWSGAVVLDDRDVPVSDRLRFRDLALRETIDRLENGWPLSPLIVGGSDFRRSGGLEASSPAYFELRPGAAGGTAQAMGLNLAGVHGGAPPDGAVLQLTLVRIQ